MYKEKKEKTNYKIYIGIIALLIFVYIYENNPYKNKILNKLILEEKILTHKGIIGIIIYILIGILLNVFLFLYMPVNIISGYLFGFMKGSAISYIIVIISAIIGFYVSKHLFKQHLEKIDNKYFNKIKEKLNKNDTFSYIKYNIIGRIMPIPFHVCNYFWGTTDVSLSVFIIGTSIGTIPWMLVEIYVGSVLKNSHNILKNSEYYNYVLIVLIIGLSSYTLYKYINERKENISNNKDETIHNS